MGLSIDHVAQPQRANIGNARLAGELPPFTDTQRADGALTSRVGFVFRPGEGPRDGRIRLQYCSQVRLLFVLQNQRWLDTSPIPLGEKGNWT